MQQESNKWHLPGFFHPQAVEELLRKELLVTTAVNALQNTSAAKCSLRHVTKLIKHASKPAHEPAMKTKALPSLLQKGWLSYSKVKAQTQAVYESTLEFEYEGNTTRWHKASSNSLGLLQELSLIQHKSN